MLSIRLLTVIAITIIIFQFIVILFPVPVYFTVTTIRCSQGSIFREFLTGFYVIFTQSRLILLLMLRALYQIKKSFQNVEFLIMKLTQPNSKFSFRLFGFKTILLNFKHSIKLTIWNTEPLSQKTQDLWLTKLQLYLILLTGCCNRR